jgi:hypothetical protein
MIWNQKSNSNIFDRYIESQNKKKAMADQELRDKSGKLLGKIKDVGGKLEIRDSTGRLKGKYDPKTNETRDDAGRLVGKGNLLAALL